MTFGCQTQRQRHSVREDKSGACAARIALFLFFFAGLRSRSPYLQCSPPPPKRYDLFPRKCRSTVDCLPDLCCPEHGKGVCRPPRESILPLVVGRLSIGPGAAAPYAPPSRWRRQRRRRPRPSRRPPSWKGPAGPMCRALSPVLIHVLARDQHIYLLRLVIYYSTHVLRDRNEFYNVSGKSRVKHVNIYRSKQACVYWD